MYNTFPPSLIEDSNSTINKVLKAFILTLIIIITTGLFHNTNILSVIIMPNYAHIPSCPYTNASTTTLGQWLYWASLINLPIYSITFLLHVLHLLNLYSFTNERTTVKDIVIIVYIVVITTLTIGSLIEINTTYMGCKIVLYQWSRLYILSIWSTVSAVILCIFTYAIYFKFHY